MSTLVQDAVEIATRNGGGAVTSKKEVRSSTAAKAELLKPQIEVPQEIQERGQIFIDSFEKFLQERTELYLDRLANVHPQAADPTLSTGYQYWNALTVGPIQFYGNPPYRPSRVIAAGELCLMLGVVWINPANGPMGSLPGTVVLGARNYRTGFESVNLTNVNNGPSMASYGIFPSPAPVINIFPFYFVPGDPGLNPNLYEMFFTADLTTPSQPFAAFSTWHYDVDSEPGFLGLPTIPAGMRHETPARFLVYRK